MLVVTQQVVKWLLFLEQGWLFHSFVNSGAGKTTLLSILCGRNSNFTGDFRINGKEVSGSSLRYLSFSCVRNRKVCRFVRQHDLFYEYLTVEEHLYYQAILRIGDRPYEEIQNRLVWVCHNYWLTHRLLRISIYPSVFKYNWEVCMSKEYQEVKCVVWLLLLNWLTIQAFSSVMNQQVD